MKHKPSSQHNRVVPVFISEVEGDHNYSHSEVKGDKCSRYLRKEGETPPTPRFSVSGVFLAMFGANPDHSTEYKRITVQITSPAPLTSPTCSSLPRL